MLDDTLVLRIDAAYFDLTGGLERWLYRLVRKHGGRQRGGWRFELRHLHVKSGSLSPYKRFAFELRDIVRRQPLPGYALAIDAERQRQPILTFSATSVPQPVDSLVLSGTRRRVLSGTHPSCYREPERPVSACHASANRPLNLDSNEESNGRAARAGTQQAIGGLVQRQLKLLERKR